MKIDLKFEPFWQWGLLHSVFLEVISKNSCIELHNQGVFDLILF
jgi:hypothetical protein